MKTARPPLLALLGFWGLTAQTPVETPSDSGTPAALEAKEPEPAAPSAASTLETEAPRPSVDDPMLTPPARAKRELTSWQQAVEAFKSRSIDLRIAEDELQRAEAQTQIALASAYPTLSGQAIANHKILTPAAGNGALGTTTTTPTAGRNSLSARISFSQTLYDARAFHSIGTAKLGRQVAELSYAEQQRTLLGSLASILIADVAAERVAELSRLGLRSALERLALTRAKERLGTGTGLDIVRSEQDVVSTRSAVMSADESLVKAREALGLALGLTEPVGIARGLDLSGIEQDALRYCQPIDTLEARADLQRAGKSIQVAARREQEVTQGYYPTLAAQSSLASSATDAGGGFRTSWDIQAVLSVPIWDGGARAGERVSAAADTDESRLQLEALRRSTRVQLTQAERAITVAERAKDIAQQERDLARDVDRLTLAAYRTGKGTSLDLVVSASALRQAEVNLALSEFDLVRTRLARLLELATCSGHL
ncbi:MAG TPA: TolC family protein [Polyangiaceae bacterium]|jgi:outer membrane protein TolC|nr:TolC family protein [Polyangiaceae bacterium]